MRAVTLELGADKGVIPLVCFLDVFLWLAGEVLQLGPDDGGQVIPVEQVQHGVEHCLLVIVGDVLQGEGVRRFYLPNQ